MQLNSQKLIFKDNLLQIARLSNQAMAGSTHNHLNAGYLQARGDTPTKVHRQSVLVLNGYHISLNHQ